MNDQQRKKSPRAPSISLNDAIERVLRVYEKEKRHPAPTDVVAQDIGYKNANNGAALSVLASLRYYGLLERPEDGKLAVAKDVETYQYTPDPDIKRELLTKWLRAPSVFAELLDRYSEGLPSDATLRFDLINRGFSAASAESVISIFRPSSDFAGYFDSKKTQRDDALASRLSEAATNAGLAPDEPLSAVKNVKVSQAPELLSEDIDRIPVRLSGNRRAWLIIPAPFYAQDKARLKAQIDLLLTEDDDVA